MSFYGIFEHFFLPCHFNHQLSSITPVIIVSSIVPSIISPSSVITPSSVLIVVPSSWTWRPSPHWRPTSSSRWASTIPSVTASTVVTSVVVTTVTRWTSVTVTTSVASAIASSTFLESSSAIRVPSVSARSWSLFGFGYINFLALNLNTAILVTVIQTFLLRAFFKKPNETKASVSPGTSVQR